MKFVFESEINKQKLRDIEAVICPVFIEAGKILKIGRVADRLEAHDSKFLEFFLKKTDKKVGGFERLRLTGSPGSVYTVMTAKLELIDFI